jgi:hypothetical protein
MSEWPRSAGVAGRALPRWLAISCVAAAVVSLVIRLPSAVSNFDDRASANDRIAGVDREIKGADGEDIDNEFLKQALRLVPATARYAIVRSQTPEVAQQYGIVAATYNALPAFVQDIMLPRRQVEPASAQFVLCYACDTDPFDSRMTRLWENQQGLVIGRLTR